MKLTSSSKAFITTLFKEKQTSRKSLSAKLGLTSPAITLISNQLLKQKVIKEVGEIDLKKAGRKELLISLNPSAYSLLGLDIKQNSFKVSLTGLNGDEIVYKDFKDFDSAFKCLSELVSSYSNILGLGVLLRGFKDIASLSRQENKWYESLNKLGVEIYIYNNVQALALIYHLYHQEENNFLLLKYGPGIGSAIFIDGKPLRSKRGTNSEIGHCISDHRTVEDLICFTSLFRSDISDEEAIKRFKADPKLLNFVLDTLARTLINADCVLSLESIICSGPILSNEAFFYRFNEIIKNNDPAFDFAKMSIFSNYQKIDRIKASLVVFYHLFVE